jgi:hypothetical protein
VKQILNIRNESISEKYLGMPSDIGNSESVSFKFLKDRIWNKVRGWMDKLLSNAGKELLIKSIAQAVPVYSMSCFKLPRGLREHINSHI